MKQFILKNKNAFIAVSAFLLVGGVMLSFQDSIPVNQFHKNQVLEPDSFPLNKKGMTMKEFDQLVEKMDHQILKVGDEIKKIDVGKIQKQAELSLKSIDMDKVMKDVESSLKEINFEKLMADINSSLKEINLDEASLEIKNALKDANLEIEKAKVELKKIDREQIRKELENVKLELEKSKNEINKIDIDRIMKEAKEEINKAKLGLEEQRKMFHEMENDRLIDPKQGFRIEYKNKELYINGEKQMQTVTDKYRKYFKEDHFEINIEKE